jgi:saccharopine dehydrogenase (NAD+, L-lysine-forming)
MVGAMMILTGKWRGSGVFNIEELEPEPFLEALPRYGLSWHVAEC